MKKTFLLTAGLLGMSSVVMAQSSIKTYDVNDADLNGIVSVADVTTVVKQVLANTPGGEVVKAADLNAVLQLIDSRLLAIKAKLSVESGNEESKPNANAVLQLIDSHLSAIESKLGIESGSDLKPVVNGIVANGHEYVDLGLTTTVTVNGVEKEVPIYWATCNVGAETPEDYGSYFAWGETVGYTNDVSDGRSFDWASYTDKLCGGASDKQKKYCTLSEYGIIDNKTVLDPEDDAATQNWKGSWRMPTYKEFSALINKCTWTWDSTKKGYKVSKNGTTEPFIFLPAAGCRTRTSLESVGRYGCYWSSSLSTIPQYAYYLTFYSSKQDWDSSSRYVAYTVRPVCVPSE